MTCRCVHAFDSSGLGYIVGAYVADWFGSWQYALRVSSFIVLLDNAFTYILCLITCKCVDFDFLQ